MGFLDSILVALKALRVNILRSILTTLGIIIGVGAVIIMVSIGSGAQSRVQQVIDSLGTNLLIIIPGTTTSGGVRLGRGTKPTITEADATAIVKDISIAELAAPMVRGAAQVVYKNQNWSTAVYGITPEYLIARDWTIEVGQAFNSQAVRVSSKVALIGQTVAENLFPGQDPVGQIVRVKKVPFRIVGLLKAKGENPRGQDQDDLIMVPLSTAKKRIIGQSRLKGGLVNTIYVKAREGESMTALEAQVRSLIRQRHRLRSGQNDDFRVRNLAQMLEARAESSRTMSLLLASVASISLLVGGIGIMNIMLVSVSERTREIGLRLAVGARRRDILTQFLIEAVSLSLIGGFLGASLGVAGSMVTANYAEWPMILSANSILISFGFAAVVGVFFGFYPAFKASRLNPIDALRYE